MRRTLIFAAGGLLLGGVIHIAVVFLVPSYAARDAWSVVQSLGPDRQFHAIAQPSPGNETFAGLDPDMLQAVCRFALADGPLRLTATLPDDFWSIAIFDRRGRNVYSLNDRSTEHAALDLALLTPVQMATLRQDPPASLATSIVVELPLDTGFAVLRVFVPDSSALADATASLRAANCSGAL